MSGFNDILSYQTNEFCLSTKYGKHRSLKSFLYDVTSPKKSPETGLYINPALRFEPSLKQGIFNKHFYPS